jgi:hypothetical protein
MSFAGSRKRMNDAIFARLGEPAAWSDVSQLVQVITREEDQELIIRDAVEMRMTRFVRVRKSEVDYPKVGDAIELESGIAFEVVAAPRLRRHLVWVCEVKLTAQP